MNCIYAILTFCVVAVTCQPRGPPSRPPPPTAKPTGKPVQISPPRPRGCSPGCGPTEICCELADSYCRAGQSCSVCIKMSSIRFPASALSNIFQQPPSLPSLPVQPQPPVRPMLPPVQSQSMFPQSQSMFPSFGGQSQQSSMGGLDWFGFNQQPQQQPPPQQQQGFFGGNNGFFPMMLWGDFGLGF